MSNRELRLKAIDNLNCGFLVSAAQCLEKLGVDKDVTDKLRANRGASEQVGRSALRHPSVQRVIAGGVGV